MGIITKGVIVLCMFYQGGIIEHTYIQSQKMSDCLKAKRQVERSVNPENVRMQCGKVDAIIEKDEYSDKMRVVKIVKDKKIFILGAGGVVPSIIIVLKKLGVAKIILSNRTKEKAADLKKIYTDLSI